MSPCLHLLIHPKLWGLSFPTDKSSLNLLTLNYGTPHRHVYRNVHFFFNVMTRANEVLLNRPRCHVSHSVLVLHKCDKLYDIKFTMTFINRTNRYHADFLLQCLCIIYLFALTELLLPLKKDYMHALFCIFARRILPIDK